MDITLIDLSDSAQSRSEDGRAFPHVMVQRRIVRLMSPLLSGFDSWLGSFLFCNWRRFMASVNSVVLVGNLTRDPVVRYTESGTAIAEFGLAMNEVWKDKAGEKHEEVTFVDVAFFGRTAEIAGEYLKKGAQVCVEGSLKFDTWEDKNGGGKRYKHSIKGQRLTMLGKAGGGGHAAPVNDEYADSVAGRSGEDEIPF